MLPFFIPGFKNFKKISFEGIKGFRKQTWQHLLVDVSKDSYAGLPDGLFSYQKYQIRFIYLFGYILEGLGMENFEIFYGYLEYVFTAIWYNLWPFGFVCGHLVYFFPFWYVWTKKNLATLLVCFIIILWIFVFFFILKSKVNHSNIET
jgi:hypothetical protein